MSGFPWFRAVVKGVDPGLRGHRPLLEEGWTLAAVGGAELARIRLSTSLRRISDKAVARRAGLTTSDPSEPKLLALVAAACLAMVIHHQQPRGATSPPT